MVVVHEVDEAEPMVVTVVVVVMVVTVLVVTVVVMVVMVVVVTVLVVTAPRNLSEEILHRAWDNASRVGALAEHSVGLSTARLTISETTRVKALQHEVDLFAGYCVEYRRLLRVRPVKRS